MLAPLLVPTSHAQVPLTVRFEETSIDPVSKTYHGNLYIEPIGNYSVVGGDGGEITPYIVAVVDQNGNFVEMVVMVNVSFVESEKPGAAVVPINLDIKQGVGIRIKVVSGNQTLYEFKANPWKVVEAYEKASVTMKKLPIYVVGALVIGLAAGFLAAKKYLTARLYEEYDEEYYEEGGEEPGTDTGGTGGGGDSG